MSKLTIYHGSKDIIEKPYYHGGKAENDYGFGFYCTESLELAKEWSCSNNEVNGFANEYTIEIDGLKVLDLTSSRYSILNWMAILLKHRTFDLSNEVSKQAKEYLIENFYIDVVPNDDLDCDSIKSLSDKIKETNEILMFEIPYMEEISYIIDIIEPKIIDESNKGL